MPSFNFYFYLSVNFIYYFREDDENDLSEDEDNHVEANIMSLNFKEKVHIERQKNRDNFLAYENGILN